MCRDIVFGIFLPKFFVSITFAQFSNSYFFLLCNARRFNSLGQTWQGPTITGHY